MESTLDMAVANTLATMFEYLGGAVGLTLSSTIYRSALVRRFNEIPGSSIVSIPKSRALVNFQSNL